MGGYEYVHDLNGDDGFLGVHLSRNSYNCIHYICTAFHTSIIFQKKYFKNKVKILSIWPFPEIICWFILQYSDFSNFKVHLYNLECF